MSAALTSPSSSSSSDAIIDPSFFIPNNFPPLQNDRILRAALHLSTDQTPIWCHRQAGRYLPEFRAVRQKHDFFSLCRTPHLAAEVTIQPIDRLSLDAAIIFSDILVIPQALGLEVKMEAGTGPVLPSPLSTPDDLSRLIIKKDGKELEELVKRELGYVFQAITLTRHQLKGRVPLLGFSGAPWTLMAYMVEGGGSKSYNEARKWFYSWPNDAKRLLNILTDIIIEYCHQQIIAGAQLIEIFDTWASDLSPDIFYEFSFPSLQRIADRLKLLHPDIPLTLFAKGANYALNKLSQQTKYDCFSLDWNCPINDARSAVGPSKTLQGNLDVSILYAPESVIREKVRRMLDEFGTQNYIANLGHGMLPDHPIEGLSIFIDEVHQYSKLLNEKNQGK